ALTALLMGIALAGTASARSEAPGEHARESAGQLQFSRVPGAELRSVLPTGTNRDRVRVAPFRLQTAPVTNREFLDFVRAHPEWRRDRISTAMADERYLQHWRSPEDLGSEAAEQQPVTNVSWFAARAFCDARGARLPAWHEWELAAAANERL